MDRFDRVADVRPAGAVRPVGQVRGAGRVEGNDTNGVVASGGTANEESMMEMWISVLPCVADDSAM